MKAISGTLDAISREEGSGMVAEPVKLYVGKGPKVIQLNYSVSSQIGSMTTHI